MYLHWTNHILDVNYKCYLYNFPREIFARIAIFWSIFAIFGIFQRRHRMCLMGAHTLNHCPLFKGCPFYILVGLSLLYHLYRPLRDYMKIGDLAKIPLSNPQMKQITKIKVAKVRIYFICGLIIFFLRFGGTIFSDICKIWENLFFFPVHGLVLCLGVIGFFIEPRLCAIFLSSKKILSFWPRMTNINWSY